MKLTAVFEHWHLGDGNYPAFAVGDEVRLSFELDAHSVAVAPADLPDSIRQVRDAEYAITGRVIRSYQRAELTFPVIEADGFRFYSPTPIASSLRVGQRVQLAGIIALDHYLWVENLHRYRDPPDLFLNLRVTRIQEVALPAKYVSRTGTSVAMPTSLPPSSYDDTMKTDVAVVGGSQNVATFSLVDLESLPSGSGPTRATFNS